MNIKKVKLSEETIKVEKTITRKYIEIDMDFTQIYSSFYLLTMGLKSTKSFQLLFYALKNLGDNNLLISNRMYDEFNRELLSHGDPGITRRTYYNCVKELEESKIISKVTRGRYFINPHIIWNGDKDKRLEFIKSDPMDSNKIAYNPTKLLPPPIEE